jgi:phage gp45-like
MLATLHSASEESTMPNGETKIVLQVGSTVRLTKEGDVVLDNPEIELARETNAADAVLSYIFDAKTGSHTLRLVDPVADRAHMKTHKRND